MNLWGFFSPNSDVEEREKGLVMVETYTFSPTGLVQAIEVVSGGQPVKTLR